jgi:hypothetical protein
LKEKEMVEYQRDYSIKWDILEEVQVEGEIGLHNYQDNKVL